MPACSVTHAGATYCTLSHSLSACIRNVMPVRARPPATANPGPMTAHRTLPSPPATLMPRVRGHARRAVARVAATTIACAEAINGARNARNALGMSASATMRMTRKAGGTAANDNTRAGAPGVYSLCGCRAPEC